MKSFPSSNVRRQRQTANHHRRQVSMPQHLNIIAIQVPKEDEMHRNESMQLNDDVRTDYNATRRGEPTTTQTREIRTGTGKRRLIHVCSAWDRVSTVHEGGGTSAWSQCGRQPGNGATTTHETKNDAGGQKFQTFEEYLTSYCKDSSTPE